MRSLLRFSLPFVAVESLLVFSQPAVAGMVATPRVSAEKEREAALAQLKARFVAEGPDGAAVAQQLDALPTPELKALAAQAESGVAAGNHNHRWFWLTVGIFVLLWFAAFDHHRFHRCLCD